MNVAFVKQLFSSSFSRVFFSVHCLDELTKNSFWAMQSKAHEPCDPSLLLSFMSVKQSQSFP